MNHNIKKFNDNFTIISVVIPALNEEGIVGKTVSSIPINKLKEMGFQVEIIVVDNDSTDNTAQEARESGARVVYQPNRGYGNAYLKGLKETKGDIIIMGDADGTYPLEYAHEFILPILEENYDFVIGSRFDGEIESGAMPPLHRYLGNPMLSKMLNILFKSDVKDTHCGMRAFKKSSIDKLDLKSPGMEFAIEMVIEASEKDLKIFQTPINYRVRGGEAKLSSIKDGWRHVNYMINRKFLKRSDYYSNSSE
ncbi:glycosyltransferase family 2 protein [Methanobacterium alcaliphilum]|uniref:glycosyltransferase family 2 protein n=1 Tax=Methanobacterium alcaliphilum TaxID=392018 RepID=UPI00200AA863|nr:glycosyltransferase family 2 protein [Methanobacterium alcaliphilum]MCK9150766.1 glycosyltransferase family 2 protein [Methanobacterium alcaliphilum]